MNTGLHVDHADEEEVGQCGGDDDGVEHEHRREGKPLFIGA
jgi:hypothetical protein